MSKWFKSDARYIMASRDSYSTTEERTGRKWTDGKDVYKKVVSLGAFPAVSSSKSVAHGVSSIDTLVAIDAMAKSGTVQFPVRNEHACFVYVSGASIVFGNGAVDRTGFTAFCIIEYTKT